MGADPLVLLITAVSTAFACDIAAQGSAAASDSAAFSDFLTAYNGGTYEALLEYMIARHPEGGQAKARSQAGHSYNLFREYGPLCVFRVTSDRYGPKRWLWASQTGTWVGIQLGFTADSSRHFDWIGIDRGVLPPGAPAGRPLGGDSLEKHLKGYMELVGREGRFSGVVAVAPPGKPLFVYAAGTADRRHGVPNRVDTRFDISRRSASDSPRSPSCSSSSRAGCHWRTAWSDSSPNIPITSGARSRSFIC